MVLLWDCEADHFIIDLKKHSSVFFDQIVLQDELMNIKSNCCCGVCGASVLTGSNLVFSVFVAAIIFTQSASAGFSAPPTKDGLLKNGCFKFPQSHAQVLYDSGELRLSLCNNASVLYVQAILWQDNSLKLGTHKNGRQYGDSSRLLLDIDADGSESWLTVMSFRSVK